MHWLDAATDVFALFSQPLGWLNIGANNLHGLVFKALAFAEAFFTGASRRSAHQTPATDNIDMESQNTPNPPAVQARNPLHGLTLERMLTDLVDYYGWEELGARIQVRSFNIDPSISSSLRFLRKTPWAREKVEGLYLYTLRQSQRRQR